MGNQNRQRRAAKKQKADRRREQTRFGDFDLFRKAQNLAVEALEHLPCPDTEACGGRGTRALGVLVDETRGVGWCRAVDTVLFGLHMDVLEKKCWPDGWQPADLARVADRELGAAARRAVTDMMAAELRRYTPTSIDDAWHDQLAELQAAVWWSTDAEYVPQAAAARRTTRSATVELLVRMLRLLDTLPAVEVLTPLPGAAHGTGGASTGSGSAVDEKLLTRVRALLAKAEGTNYEAEAETFTAAAQAMMARHNIDEAMLRSRQSTGRSGRFAGGGPGGIRLGVDNPYAEPKAILLQQVAEANRCRTVWSRDLGFSTVIGFRPDTAWVSLLYTSLLVQASTAMARAGTKTAKSGVSRTRAFRASFLESFAVRIGERLRETTAHAQEDAVTANGPGLLPVLASRERAVEDEISRIFPEISRSARSGRRWDLEGWHAGRAAADLADLARGNAIGDGTA